MPETILGKVSVTPKGAYAAGTQYERLDAVSHGGGSWMALRVYLRSRLICAKWRK